MSFHFYSKLQLILVFSCCLCNDRRTLTELSDPNQLQMSAGRAFASEFPMPYRKFPVYVTSEPKRCLLIALVWFPFMQAFADFYF